MQDLPKQIKNFIPHMSPTKHKGQSGRVGVLGGCFEYTGAPYVTAMCAIKTVSSECVHKSKIE